MHRAVGWTAEGACRVEGRGVQTAIRIITSHGKVSITIIPNHNDLAVILEGDRVTRVAATDLAGHHAV